MSVFNKDGTVYVSATRVTRLDCSVCGPVLISRHPMNDRTEEEAVKKHLRDKHGGVWTG